MTFKDPFSLQKYVTKSSEPLGKRLFQYLMKHWQKEAGGSLTTSESEQCAVNKGDVLSSVAFTAAASHLMALHTDSQQMEFYIKVCIYSIYFVILVHVKCAYI